MSNKKSRITFEELTAMVQTWAKVKGIYDDKNASVYTQLDKLSEEFNELQRALATHESAIASHGVSFKDLEDEVKDGFGDVLVCLINAAYFAKVDLIQALTYAYNQITDPKRNGGQMVNGKYVKPE